ncbi:hypothetical protein DFH11DRAFT_1623112 [Phellopilus nigrolimitatus]|nr:hypothetical protein DFH11DRAFT_1623112 [Phellopilus nigrolimitatus]
MLASHFRKGAASICRKLLKNDDSAFKCGVHSLPDKILSRIFLIMHEVETVYSAPIILSVVSRRFRAIALDTPALWTCVSNEMSADELKTFLSRSKDQKLLVRLRANGIPRRTHKFSPRLEMFLSNVLPHAGRMDAFAGATKDWRELFHLLLGYTEGMRFPSMEVLRIHFPNRDSPGLQPSPDYPAALRWKLPKLRHLELLNFVPLRKLAIEKHLESCRVDFKHELRDISTLLKFLRNVSGVKKLSLDFPAHSDVHLSSPIDFPHLEELEISATNIVFTQLLTAIRAPILTTLLVKSYDFLDFPQAGSILPLGFCLPTVRKLTILSDLRATPDGRNMVPFLNSIFSGVQGTTALSLTFPNTPPPKSFAGLLTLPHLYKLELDHCNLFTKTAVIALADGLCSRKRGRRMLGKLDIAVERRLSRKDLESAFLFTKINWVEDEED